jgi:FMNH2-dependent dimethyl sulfone monooxygenase
MEASWDYMSRLVRRSEEIGYDLTLIAELNMNDTKGRDAPVLDAWSTAAALAAVTQHDRADGGGAPQFPSARLVREAIVEHRPDQRRPARAHVVSSWWADEAKQYGLQFDQP